MYVSLAGWKKTIAYIAAENDTNTQRKVETSSEGKDRDISGQ